MARQKAVLNITNTPAVIALGEEICARLRARKSTDKITTDAYGNVLCERDKKIVIYPGEGIDRRGEHFFDVVCTVGGEDTILQSFNYPSRAAFIEAACDAVFFYIGHRVKTVKYREKFKCYGMDVYYEDARGSWVRFDGFRVEGLRNNFLNIRTDRTEEIVEYKL